MDVNLMILDGVMGAGKTLGMSVLAKDWAERSGATLYSNYGLVGSKPFTKFQDFLDVAKQDSSIICLDESHIDLSSRDFNSNSVKFFTNMVFYLRKLRCTLIMTSPLYENIDSRVRQVTNVYIQVSKDNSYFYYDLYDVQQGRFIKTKKMRLSALDEIKGSLFNTYEMVTPLEYPEKREHYIQIMELLKKENILYLENKGQAS